jgi:hypothetical protein
MVFFAKKGEDETSKINPYALLCIQRPWEQKPSQKKKRNPDQITKKTEIR